MTTPAAVSTLNANWATTLAGRDFMHFHAAGYASTEEHAIFYSNGRIESSYEYSYSGPGGQVFNHDDYYGQWWIANSRQEQNGAYVAEVAVYWYDSTDPNALGEDLFSVATIDGVEFYVDGDLYGATQTTDAAGAGNDHLDATTSATLGPTLLGKEGNDILIGRDDQNNHLYGGPGNDNLEGRGGGDLLYGQEGNDTLSGGAGDDVAIYFSAASNFTVQRTGGNAYLISDKQGTEGNDALNGVEYVQFANSAPVAIETLASAGNVLTGTDGNDVLAGGPGNDTVDGGAGTDYAVIRGLASQYTLQAQGASFVLSGPDGNDTLTSIEYLRFGTDIGEDWAVTNVAPGDLASGAADRLLEQITDLYVAYFNRAPDSGGLAFWFQTIYSGQYSLRTIAERFTFEQEYLQAYPSSLANRDFVEQIYLNLFDRNPDAGGWDWWTNELDTGHRQRSGFILDVIEGAYAPTSGPEDRTLIDNKHEASLYYSGQLSLQPEEGFDATIATVLNLVSGEADTVAAAERVIDYAFDNPATLAEIVGNAALFDSLWMG